MRRRAMRFTKSGSKKHPGGNVGVLTGVKLDESFSLLVVDVDSEELVAGVEAQIGAYPYA